MAAAETTQRAEDRGIFTLHPGPRWESFEEFRADGSKGLRMRVDDDQIGRLNVKGDEFVIMRAGSFNRLYGLAQDVGRLSRGMLLIRQAVQLVLHTGGSKVAIEHLRDLIYLLPELEQAPTSKPGALYFEQDEQADGEDNSTDMEIDPARVRRPTFGNFLPAAAPRR